jgi:hypothetical protein
MTQRATDRTPSRSLHGVTELTVLAPLKRGPVAAMDTRSHETRVVAVMRTLDAFRVSSVETEPTPLIQDVIERIRGIHSFRLAVVGEPLRRQLLLAVSFDGGWEPYLRRIWRELGPFLDLLFGNCDGYPLSRRSGYAAYARWVRRSQATTEFVYHWGAATVNDLVTVFARSPRASTPAPEPGVPTSELLRQCLPALTALYRLTDMHPPATVTAQPGLQGLAADDGLTLLHAARLLLPGLDGLGDADLTAALGRAPTATESAALAWLQPRVPAAKPLWPDIPWSLSQVQSGIVRRQEGVHHAALLLLSLDSPQAGAALLQWLVVEGRLARGEPAHPAPAAGDVYWTVSFTANGLACLGLDAGQLEQLPAEFVQGMAARASVLGDVQHNHPSRWRPPLACAPDGTAVMKPGRVELAGVHAVVQVALRGGPPAPWCEATDPAHALHGSIRRLLADLPGRAGGEGVRLLSVQTMRRVPPPQPAGAAAAGGHFGFADGLSQPVVAPDGRAPATAPAGADEVPAGDLLLGHPNSLGDEPLTGRLWENGSFLVVRRLRQDVAAYERALPGAVQQLAAQGLTLSSQDVAALLMGRRHDGRNLVDDTTGNRFDYQADPQGVKCPWQSHVRRANPRATRHGAAVADQVTLPRLMRRGMSYGPSSQEGPADAERGLVFMAYNASIAEQFEVIQGWLAGGNSSSPTLPSRLADPFLAAHHPGEPARFRFRTAAAAGAAVPCVEHEVSLGTEPFTVLEWGLYLFAPSVEGLDELRRIAIAAQVARHPAPAAGPMREERRLALERERLGLAVAGQRVVQGLQRAEQALGLDAQTALREWKLLLEDPGARRQGLPQAVWAAVRAAPGGLLRTPFGVLVGSAERVAEVFGAPSGRYTVAGYQARMEKSFGPIFLGMDAGADYAREATQVNAAIMDVTLPEAWREARAAMASVLQARRPPAGPGRSDAVLDLRDLVDTLLAALSRSWFGLPDDGFVHEGGWHWRDGPPRCPGHFHTPSRYLFQPHPGAEAAAVGQAHGQLLRQQVGNLVARHWRQPAPLGRLGRAIHAALHALEPDEADAQDLVARTLVGVMMGFLPTVDGNLRGVLFDWLDDGTFWDLRRRLAAARPAGEPADDDDALARVRAVLDAPLARGLQRRPVPDLVWRTVVQAHTLGEVSLQPGDVVVVGIGSALHQRQLEDDPSLSALFGGDRHSPGQDSVPLHACPGQAMALGVLTGALDALMAEPGLQPGPSPALLTLRP